MALYRNERWQEAIDALVKARQMRGGNDPLHRFFLAMAYWQNDQHDEGLKNYGAVSGWMLSGNRPAEQRRFQAEAEQLIPAEEIASYCQELIEKNESTAELLAVSAAALVRLGRWDTAVKEYAQMVPLLPATDDPWRGTIAGSNTPAVQSDEVYGRLALLQPDHRVLRIARVHYLAAQGRWEELTPQLQAAIELDPTDQWGWYNMAAVQLSWAMTQPIVRHVVNCWLASPTPTVRGRSSAWRRHACCLPTGRANWNWPANWRTGRLPDRRTLGHGAAWPSP